jgi:hypothetical protein
MTDTYEHNPNDHEDPVAGPTWTVSIVGAVLFVVSVLGVAALYYNVVSEEEVAKRYEDPPADETRQKPLTDLQQLDREQLARLDGPVRIERRVEVPEGALVIPIDQAMELIIEEAGQE